MPIFMGIHRKLIGQRYSPLLDSRIRGNDGDSAYQDHRC